MPTIRRVIAVILCVYAAGNALWLWENQNRCVGSAYHARHFMRAAQFYNLAEGYSPPSKFYRALHEDRFYPAPLHSLTSAVGMTIFGKNVPLVTGFINFLYFAASLMFLAILAAELGYPPAVAAWALILYALYPAVYGMSRLYGAFDFQVAAMTPLAAVVLLRTRQFASRRHCLILADNGSDMYIQGTMDARWDNDILNPAFHSLHADDFEVIQLGWMPQTSGVP